MSIDFGKYAPTTLDEFLGNFRTVQNLKAVLEKHKQGIIIIIGASGMGKTALANLVLGTKKSRSIKAFPCSPEDAQHIHEDGYFDSDTISVVTALTLGDVPQEAMSRALLTIELEKPPVSVLTEHVMRICSKEGISATKTGVSTLCGLVSPTVAHLYHNLEAVIDVTGEVTTESVHKVLGIPDLEDQLAFFKALLTDDYVHYLKLVSSRFNSRNTVRGLQRVLQQGSLLVNGVTDIDVTLEERSLILQTFKRYKEDDLRWVLAEMDKIRTSSGLILMIYAHSALKAASPIVEPKPDAEIVEESKEITEQEHQSRGDEVLSQATQKVDLKSLLRV